MHEKYRMLSNALLTIINVLSTVVIKPVGYSMQTLTFLGYQRIKIILINKNVKAFKNVHSFGS